MLEQAFSDGLSAFVGQGGIKAVCKIAGAEKRNFYCGVAAP
ncbi:MULTISPECIES: hypothetical protein [unclassified Neisseria]|nr:MULTISPECIES: hypothetical protein [unclassified Neisseria]MDO1510357.1 hypothetical protein [Neisseria sp. MVDL19-042950]MDO1516526.1 hypothetical protein [Neisseria sp. MVDL18-041461]MDO1563681.1 hypothetical protein [Neisseria sp. MVDL20-010259]